ncbi:MAG TPA: hypothetical protein VLS45_08730 [Methylomicrobium sp.]|nr:hypothetical protein [Methylomicrobium sp.]
MLTTRFLVLAAHAGAGRFGARLIDGWAPPDWFAIAANETTFRLSDSPEIKKIYEVIRIIN